MDLQQFIKNQEVFSDLSESEFKDLNTMFSYHDFSVGQTILEEGIDNDNIYIVISGSVEVSKIGKRQKFHKIASLSAGSIFGEISAISSAKTTAAAIAITPVRIASLSFLKLRQAHNLKRVCQKIQNNVNEVLSLRLADIDVRIVSEIEHQLYLKEKQVISASFVLIIFVMLATYILCLNFLRHGLVFGNNSLASIGVILFFTIGSIIYIKINKLKPAQYGMSLENIKQKCWQAFLYTIPLLIVVVILKILLLYFKGQPILPNIFTPGADFGEVDKVSSWFAYFGLLGAYVLLVLLQNLSIRGATQTALQEFFAYKNPWYSILIVNLIFTATHVHKSFAFAACTFIPGLFWAWLYYRQQSVISVSLSHLVAGVWATFIVGFQVFIS